MQRLLLPLLGLLLSLSFAPRVDAADPNYTRQEDVIYGRKFGTALTLDVFTPKGPTNGAAVVMVVSGGWFSSHDNINVGFFQSVLDRGYTVFAVVHGSNPRFTILDAISDMNRAVRYIRHRAADFKIDPERIGIMGGSAGGHLSLMQGMAGTAGNPDAKDPVDRQSSRVQSVACFYPPTDFLNYGKEGENAMGRGVLANFRAPFDFEEFDPKAKEFVAITDEARLLAIAKQISPAYHVTADDPPTLIIHGDADLLVPIQQSKLVMDKLEEVKVPHELVVRPGAVHGWKDLVKDVDLFADWFDKHLKKAEATK
ncbi:MAG: axeA [Planctomycetaceae bacterium]|nr:axeA [Planctomycetaceae bacterium]